MMELSLKVIVGLAIADKQSVSVKVLDSKSALDEDAKFTGDVKMIKKVPLTDPRNY